MSDRRPPTETFGQFCAALNHYGVDYVVIGSEAVAFHGVPRFSVDFDVFVRPTTANLFRIKAALESLGFRLMSCFRSAASTMPPRRRMRPMARTATSL